MEKRSIGSLSVSVVGLGCNNFGSRLDENATRRVIDAALDAGVNFLDTADIYAQGVSEEFIGKAVAGRRDDVVIATKFAKPMHGAGSGASDAYIRSACEASLRRLKTDTIDLYQQHQPDPNTPLDETAEALARLIEEGKVREVGYSNFDADLLRKAQHAIGRHGMKAASVQNEYSLFHREPEERVLTECEHLGLAFLPYFPLASGLLTGKYRKGKPLPKGTRIADGWASGAVTEEKLDRVEQLIQFAESRGYRLLDVAISWLLSRTVVASVIAGATSPEQIKANAAASHWQLTTADLSEIDSIVP